MISSDGSSDIEIYEPASDDTSPAVRMDMTEYDGDVSWSQFFLIF